MAILLFVMINYERVILFAKSGIVCEVLLGTYSWLTISDISRFFARQLKVKQFFDKD